MSTQLEQMKAVYEAVKLETRYSGLVSHDRYMFPGDIDKENSLLERFLRARDFNLEKAEVLLRKCLELRIKTQAEKLYLQSGMSVLTEPGAEVYAADTGLFTDNGNPIAVGRLALFDGKLVANENHLRGMFAVIEHVVHKIPETADGIIYIIDLETPPKKPESADGVGLVKESLHRVNLMFPEVASKIIFINSSRTFKAIWWLVSWILTKRTTGKIHILGSSYKAELAKLVGANNLFPCYGGTAKGPETVETLDELIMDFRKNLSTGKMLG